MGSDRHKAHSQERSGKGLARLTWDEQRVQQGALFALRPWSCCPVTSASSSGLLSSLSSRC